MAFAVDEQNPGDVLVFFFLRQKCVQITGLRLGGREGVMVSWVCVGKSAFFPIVYSSHLVCITSSSLQGLFISATCKPFSSVQIFPQNDLFFIYRLLSLASSVA